MKNTQRVVFPYVLRESLESQGVNFQAFMKDFRENFWSSNIQGLSDYLQRARYLLSGSKDDLEPLEMYIFDQNLSCILDFCDSNDCNVNVVFIAFGLASLESEPLDVGDLLFVSMGENYVEFINSCFINCLISGVDVKFKSSKSNLLILRVAAPGIDRLRSRIKRFGGEVVDFV